MAQVRVIQALARKGLLGPGTALEVVPRALPADASQRDSRAYLARVADPSAARAALIWELDGQSYSPTQLTTRLWVHYGVHGEPMSRYPSYYSYWRIVGHELSLWDEWNALDNPGE
jgi:hypothetical protein